MTVLTKSSAHIFEGISLLVGIVGIISSVIFYLDHYGMINIAYEISQEVSLFFFLAMTLISGIVLVLSTIGMMGLR